MGFAALNPPFGERARREAGGPLGQRFGDRRGAGRAASGNAGSRGPLQPIEHLAIYPKMSSG